MGTRDKTEEQAIPAPRHLADLAREVQPEPLAPLAAAAACWGGGATLGAVLPPAAAVAVAAGGTALSAGLGTLAGWHGWSVPDRAYALAAGTYGTGWAALAAAGGAHGPLGSLVLAGAGALSVPWWVRHGRSWTPKPKVRPVRMNGQPAPDPTAADDLRAEWLEYVACQGGALPGTTLSNVEQVPFGLGADIRLHRGKQHASMAISAAEMVASGMDRPPTQIVVEAHPSGRSSLARVTVLERDVLADVHPYQGSRLDPATGLAVIGKFFDGQDVLVRYWEPGSGAVHWILAGNTGNGKSTLLFLLIATVVDPANPVPVVPFILDPEEGGQSTVHWQKKLKYAFNGEDECIAALRGLDAIMKQRSVDMAAEGLDHFDPTPERPLIFVPFEEASAMLSESVYKDEAAGIVTRIGKRGRKRGISMVPVTPVPSLDEIDSQVFRSMMRSGNVICFRTGDPVSGGMLGLKVDPQMLPKRFADGSRAYGVCYVIAADDRQAPVRTENITREQKTAIASAAAEHPLDASSAAAFRTAYEASFEPEDEDQRPAAPDAPPPASMSDARQSASTAAAAVLRYLADGQPRTRGEVMHGIRHVTTSPSTVGYALRQLVTEEMLSTAGEKQPYVITDAGRQRLAEVA